MTVKFTEKQRKDIEDHDSLLNKELALIKKIAKENQFNNGYSKLFWKELINEKNNEVKLRKKIFRNIIRNREDYIYSECLISAESFAKAELEIIKRNNETISIIEELKRPKGIGSRLFFDKKLSSLNMDLLATYFMDAGQEKRKKTVSSCGGKGKSNRLDLDGNPKKQIQAIWRLGKYESKDKCAEENYKKCGFNSFTSARKRLKNI